MSVVIPFSVADEYKKHENVNPEEICRLREWIKTQPHLPHEHITEMDLVLAYHSCGFDTEQTKKGLDLNYTLRTILTFYQNRDIDNSLEQAFSSCDVVKAFVMILDLCLYEEGTVPGIAVLLNMDNVSLSHLSRVDLTVAQQAFVMILDLCLYEEGTVPGIAVLLNMDNVSLSHLSRVDLTVAQQAFVMILDLCLYEEGTVPGIAVLLNMDNVSLSHLSRVDLTVAQQFFYFLQEGMFVHLKEFHFINAPSFMDKLMSMFKPFMKEDMLRIVHSHQAGSNTVNEYLPITALPKDAEESRKTVNESARPGGPKTMSTFFPSLEGSFKKLEID
ncbi:hypothetical protein OBRU01_08122 [Operophtera brumata]|uniref:CRAL-TRIO domain-containing protein n=1 Tax=Operophtera brumata TaxID=104452 RepID=A0A0L7LI44_OPEBR|nr:hypothetical protein OBRU01_08122 [Operophtera brumata]